jgi:hypothetical protein
VFDVHNELVLQLCDIIKKKTLILAHTNWIHFICEVLRYLLDLWLQTAMTKLALWTLWTTIQCTVPWKNMCDTGAHKTERLTTDSTSCPGKTFV